MAVMRASYYRYSGSIAELSRTLFGEEPVALVGGSPIECAVPAAGSVVDVSIPTFAGVNPSRIKARAYIQRMDRVLGDPDTDLFAVYGCPVNPAIEPLEDEESAAIAQCERAFFPTLCEQNDNAATIAHYLVCHPLIAEVRYPGLKQDPCFDDAAQALAHGFGNAVDYILEDIGDFNRIIVGEGEPFDQIEALESELSSFFAPESAALATTMETAQPMAPITSTGM